MKLSQFLLTLLLLLTGSLAVASAQSDRVVVTKVPCDGGVLNSKVLTPFEPVYPRKAKKARAEGNVVIRVRVNEEGKVYDASVCMGHPLLQRAAEDAAYRTSFSPTLLSGHAVKVTGVIVYVFRLDAGRGVLPRP